MCREDADLTVELDQVQRAGQSSRGRRQDLQQIKISIMKACIEIIERVRVNNFKSKNKREAGSKSKRGVKPTSEQQ
jgi:hypothetical protein